MKRERVLWLTLAFYFFNLAMAADVGGHVVWFIFAAVVGGIAIVLYDRSAPPPQNFDPQLLRTFDNLGLAVAFFVAPLLSLHKDILLNDRAPLTLFLSVSFTAAGSFFMLLMVRPVTTDFGLLTGLYYLSFAIACDFFGFGFPTFLAAGPLFFMLVIRDQVIIRRRE